MPYTLTLTDHEANLVERALRRQTRLMSDAEHVAIGRIADRLLRDIIYGPIDAVAIVAKAKEQARAITEAGHIFATGDIDFLNNGDDRRWSVLKAIDHTTTCTGTVTRQTDEYACSCGARWEASDGEAHP